MRRNPLPWLVAALVLLVPAIAAADDGTFAEYQNKGTVWMYLGAFGWLEDVRPENKALTPVQLDAELSKVFNQWNEGDLDSYLIQITADILQQPDPVKQGSYLVDNILDTVHRALNVESDCNHT